MPKHTHILNAASNLLGISLLIIAGLKVANRSPHTLADEIAWVAALCFSMSCALSYLAVRSEPRGASFEAWADRIFMLGLITMVGAVAMLAFVDSSV